MARVSILDYFLESAQQTPNSTAVLQRQGSGYQPVTWGALAEQVHLLAVGLLQLGVQPGERIGLLSQTRLEWVLLDLAIMHVGGVTVPIYASNTAEECQYIIDNAGASVVFTEDRTQTKKFVAEKARLPTLRHLIQINGSPSAEPADVELAAPSWVQSLATFQQAAVAAAATQATTLQQRQQNIKRDTLMTLIYTSGTTGRPKGVMITHDNMLSVAEAIARVDIVRDTDVQLLFLPLAHVFAKILMVAWLSTRHVLAFGQGTHSVREDLLEVRPTLMAGVPRIYEKFYAAVLAKGTQKPGLQKILFEQAVKLSEKNGLGRLSCVERWQFKVLQRLIFSKVSAGLKTSLGGRMRVLVSGGAPLASKISWFFRDAGCDILEGWGLTETCAASCINRIGRNHIGTVGLPLPGTEINVASDGELLLRGRGVMLGYWNDARATQEALKDGWFHTGDIGLLEKDGNVRIVDRKKDLIVTAGGKNIAPQNLENALKTHKLLSQVVVHGDRRKFVSALLTLDADALKQFAQEHHLGAASYAELTQRQEVCKAVETLLEDFNKTLPQYETIKKFKILTHDFSQESGELTASLKIKRKLINERYKDIFDGFYDESF